MKKINWQYAVALAIIVLFTVNVIGWLFGWESISVFAAAQEKDKYEVRSELLQQAMDYVGVGSALRAAEVWAEGLRMRSAAMQYSVMSKKTRESYAAQLEKTAPNWVTGMSSPWVQDYEVIRNEPVNKNAQIIGIRVHTATSTGLAESYEAELHIRREGEFRRIFSISADSGLKPYMGLLPDGDLSR